MYVYVYTHMCKICIYPHNKHTHLLKCMSLHQSHTHTPMCVRTHLNVCMRVCVCFMHVCTGAILSCARVCLCERMHILRLAPVCVLVRLGAGVWLLGGGAQQGSAVLCASAASRDPVLTGTKSPGTAVYAPPTSLFSRRKRRTTLGDAGRQMQVRGNR